MKYLAVAILLMLVIVSFSSFQNAHNEIKSGGSLLYKDNILWYPTRELTWLGNSTHPAVVESNGDYDIVWQDHRNGNWDLYYLKITPWGFKLVNDTRITSYSGADTNPALAVSGNYVFIVWQRFVNGYWAIYFARLLYSDKNISIDVPPTPVRVEPYNCTNPKIVVDSNGYIDIVWQEYDRNWKIMYDKLNEFGNRVFNPVNVSQSTTNSTRPALTVDKANNVQVLWIDDSTTPGYSIMYRGLNSYGCFITPVRRVSVVSPDTTLTVNYDKNLQVVFSGNRENQSSEIMYTELNDTGITIFDDRNLTAIDTLNSSEPSFISKDSRIFLTWREYPGIIKFGLYNTEGKIIENPINISNGNSKNPKIAVSEDNLIITWQETLNGKIFLFMRSGKFPNLKPSNLSIKQREKNMLINATIQCNFSVKITTNYVLTMDNKTVKKGNVSFESETKISFSVLAGKGKHYIALIVDPDNYIFESNESDNEIAENFFVKVYSYKVYYQKNYYLLPGNFTNLSVYVLNTGNWKDNYTTMINKIPPYMEIHMITQNITLASDTGGYVNFTLQTNPQTPLGNYSVNITVCSAENTTQNVTVWVHIIPVIAFRLQYSSINYAIPGTFTSIRIKLINMGNCNDSYSITALFTKSWIVSISNRTLNISKGQESYITVKIYLSNGTIAFKKDIIFLKVTSSYGNLSENATLVVIASPYHAVMVNVQSEKEENDVYQISLNVKNIGNIADFYTFSVGGEFANYTELSEYSSMVSEDSNLTLNMVVHIPSNATAGAHIILFYVKIGNITLKTEPVTVTVAAHYYFTATLRNVGNEKSIRLELSIKNNGNAITTIFVTPKISKNISWDIVYNGKNHTNETYVVLNSGEIATLIIYPGEKLSDGNYKVSISLKATSGMQRTLNINVHIGVESSVWSFIMENLLYIILAVAVGVSVVVYLFIRS